MLYTFKITCLGLHGIVRSRSKSWTVFIKAPKAGQYLRINEHYLGLLKIILLARTFGAFLLVYQIAECSEYIVV